MDVIKNSYDYVIASALSNIARKNDEESKYSCHSNCRALVGSFVCITIYFYYTHLSIYSEASYSLLGKEKKSELKHNSVMAFVICEWWQR